MLTSDETIIRFQLNQLPRTHRQEAGVNARILLTTKAVRQSLRDRFLLNTGELLVEIGNSLKHRVTMQTKDCPPLIKSRANAQAR